MSNTVLTLDEINLLKHSEEPKNIKLYGNLYSVLCSIEKPKAMSLEQLLSKRDCKIPSSNQLFNIKNF